MVVDSSPEVNAAQHQTSEQTQEGQHQWVCEYQVLVGGDLVGALFDRYRVGLGRPVLQSDEDPDVSVTH